MHIIAILFSAGLNLLHNTAVPPLTQNRKFGAGRPWCRAGAHHGDKAKTKRRANSTSVGYMVISSGSYYSKRDHNGGSPFKRVYLNVIENRPNHTYLFWTYPEHTVENVAVLLLVDGLDGDHPCTCNFRRRSALSPSLPYIKDQAQYSSFAPMRLFSGQYYHNHILWEILCPADAIYQHFVNLQIAMWKFDIFVYIMSYQRQGSFWRLFDAKRKDPTPAIMMKLRAAYIITKPILS